jgi:hypothetical protein
LINLSNRVALVTQALVQPSEDRHLSEVVAVYLGFEDSRIAEQEMKRLKAQHPKTQIDLKRSKWLKTEFELEVRGSEAEQIAWDTLRGTPTTSQRIEAHLARLAARPSLAPDALVMPRHTRRTVIISSDRAIGID